MSLVADDLDDDPAPLLDDLLQLVQRDLVEVYQFDDVTAPRFSPTARGLKAINRLPEDPHGD